MGQLRNGNGQFSGPEGIAVDSSNNVYVADTGNSRVEKFDSNGNYLTQWGSYGSGNGQFELPKALRWTAATMFMWLTGNNRVEKFTATATYLTQWGSYGSGNGQFEIPHGIAVDSSGNFIYVADYNYRIQVFVNNTNIVPPIITQPAREPNCSGRVQCDF
jgi:tripartite motif-containing protein 71